MKKFFKNVVKTAKEVTCMATLAIVGVTQNGIPAYASPTGKPDASTGKTGIEKIDNGIATLKTVFIVIIGGIGFFYLGKGLIELFGALPERDSASIKQGALTAFAGFAMCCTGAIIALLGF